MTPAIFLSYSSEDAQLGQEIGETLRDSGADVWDMFTSIKPGDVWAASLSKAVSAADYFIILLTDKADPARWMYQELSTAFSRNRRVIPLLLSESAEVPPILRPYQYVDLSNPGTRRDKLRSLVAQISDGLESPYEEYSTKQAVAELESRMAELRVVSVIEAEKTQAHAIRLYERVSLALTVTAVLVTVGALLLPLVPSATLSVVSTTMLCVGFLGGGIGYWIGRKPLSRGTWTGTSEPESPLGHER